MFRAYWDDLRLYLRPSYLAIDVPLITFRARNADLLL